MSAPLEWKTCPGCKGSGTVARMLRNPGSGEMVWHSHIQCDFPLCKRGKIPVGPPVDHPNYCQWREEHDEELSK